MSNQVLKRLFEEGFKADISLSVKGDDRTLPAHRFILIESCDYFKALLSAKIENESLSISGTSFECLLEIVRFLYTGEISEEESNSLEKLENLALAASLMNLDIVPAIRESIKKLVTVDNISDFLNNPYWKDDEGLRTFLEAFLSDNFEAISNTVGFTNLSVETMKCVLEEKDFNPSFPYALKWINHDFAARQDHVPKLLWAMLLKPRFEKASQTEQVTISFLMDEVLKFCNCCQSKIILISFLAKYCK